MIRAYECRELDGPPMTIVFAHSANEAKSIAELVLGIRFTSIRVRRAPYADDLTGNGMEVLWGHPDTLDVMELHPWMKRVYYESRCGEVLP